MAQLNEENELYYEKELLAGCSLKQVNLQPERHSDCYVSTPAEKQKVLSQSIQVC